MAKRRKKRKNRGSAASELKSIDVIKKLAYASGAVGQDDAKPYIHNSNDHFKYAFKAIRDYFSEVLTGVHTAAMCKARNQTQPIANRWKKVYKACGFSENIKHKEYAEWYHNLASTETNSEESFKRAVLINKIRNLDVTIQALQELKKQNSKNNKKLEVGFDFGELLNGLMADQKDFLKELRQDFIKEYSNNGKLADQTSWALFRSLLIKEGLTYKDLESLCAEVPQFKEMLSTPEFIGEGAEKAASDVDRNKANPLSKFITDMYDKSDVFYKLSNNFASFAGTEMEVYVIDSINRLITKNLSNEYIKVYAKQKSTELKQGGQDKRNKLDMKKWIHGATITTSMKTTLLPEYYIPDKMKALDTKGALEWLRAKNYSAHAQHVLKATIPLYDLLKEPNYLSSTGGGIGLEDVAQILKYIDFNVVAFDRSKDAQEIKRIYVAIACWLHLFLHILGGSELSSNQIPMEIDLFNWSYRTDDIVRYLERYNPMDILATTNDMVVRAVQSSYKGFLGTNTTTEIKNSVSIKELKEAKSNFISNLQKNEKLTYEKLISDPEIKRLLGEVGSKITTKEVKARINIHLQNLQSLMD